MVAGVIGTGGLSLVPVPDSPAARALVNSGGVCGATAVVTRDEAELRV